MKKEEVILKKNDLIYYIDTQGIDTLTVFGYDGLKIKDIEEDADFEVIKVLRPSYETIYCKKENKNANNSNRRNKNKKILATHRTSKQ